MTRMRGMSLKLAAPQRRKQQMVTTATCQHDWQLKS
jgi:hypothetical protein